LDQLPILYSLCDEPDAIMQVILEVFMEIAVLFQPRSATMLVLSIKAGEIATRVKNGGRRRMQEVGSISSTTSMNAVTSKRYEI